MLLRILVGTILLIAFIYHIKKHWTSIVNLLNHSTSSDEVKNSIWRAFLTVGKILFFALGAAYCFSKFTISDDVISVTQIISAFLILWALIGKLGWSIQTIGGQTPMEKANDFWFLVLNTIGIFCLFFSQFYIFLHKHS